MWRQGCGRIETERCGLRTVVGSASRQTSARGAEEPEDRTRELPQVDAGNAPRRRERPDWAEETPLDDLPSLADEMLGPHEDDHGDDDGRGGGRWRRR